MKHLSKHLFDISMARANEIHSTQPDNILRRKTQFFVLNANATTTKPGGRRLGENEKNLERRRKKSEIIFLLTSTSFVDLPSLGFRLIDLP